MENNATYDETQNLEEEVEDVESLCIQEWEEVRRTLWCETVTLGRPKNN